MKTTRIATGCLLVSICSASLAHDLRGIVSERNSLDAATEKKFEDIATLKRLMAQRVKAGDKGLEAVVRTAMRWPKSSISVCFFGGNPVAHERVVSIAADWYQDTGVRFDFGPAEARRACSPAQVSDIRVSFAPGSGHWAYVGTSAKHVAANLPTMNLDALDHADPISEYERSVIVHEFGHALGFEHEHQSPNSGCQEEFDWDYLDATMGWPPEKVRFNMARFDQTTSANELEATAFDSESTMLYSLDSRAFKNPQTAKCLIRKPNPRPSRIDLRSAAYLYPSLPQVGAPHAPAAAAAAAVPASDAGLDLAKRLRAALSSP
jgi:hypothetical protein